MDDYLLAQLQRNSSSSHLNIRSSFNLSNAEQLNIPHLIPLAILIASSTMEPHQLLPALPPELRNLVFAHTISEANPATNTGLPFKQKVYDSKQTKVVIVPVHHGNTALLALNEANFSEAEEYLSWLLTNAIELRIAVLFKGDANAFVQEHWDQKIQAHLKNLVKKWPWLGKVVRYDVRIVWEPTAWKRSKRKKTVGAIAASMVEVLIGAMDGDLKRKRGVVKAGLHVRDFVAHDYVYHAQELGLKDFLAPKGDAVNTQVREVCIAPDGLGALGPKLPPHLRSLPDLNEEKDLLVEEKGIVEWGLCMKGRLLLRREVELGKAAAKSETGECSGQGDPAERTYLVLMKECLGAGEE
ncbi:hypothetical protein BU26DRAFT_448327 [Trematosphaeria pertusa]|uniref:Uncharacterized protein n=1 Tax=Trematosphaeria pertusa TaxID=390896 RepID=A0A6A6IX25_9PLEO|nr:uncharacterized protein BU26DRAFT_448327 [Trematosphaeria pertusa]KAF2255091.1 hypothetical protein BU26DRAFT_448327 [Trematosphaeria pertusa]